MPSSIARKVRRRFEERFTARRMATDYVRVYRGLARQAAHPPRAVRFASGAGLRAADQLVSDVDPHAE